MEAATPLRAPHVRVVGDRVVVDGLIVDDECAVRLVSEREHNGEDAVKLVRDAVEIGARVLDREQAGANAEFVKTEFERAATQLNSEFTDKARQVAEFLGERVDSVFGAENGQLAKELEKHFSDGSSASVQNRVRELVNETLARSREDLIRQFSAADGNNPLADFKAGTIRVLKAAEERQHESQQALMRQMAELEKQLQALGSRRRSSRRSRPSASGAPPRGAPSRSTSPRRSTGSHSPRATSPRQWATSPRRRARSATLSSRSTLPSALRAAGSLSRRRTSASRSREP
jgi:hypothetical protein